MKKKNRSFQNVMLTYENIINEVVYGNENSNVICYEGEERKIGKPIIQYMETSRTAPPWDVPALAINGRYRIYRD